jgi:iron complex transport system permease protein
MNAPAAPRIPRLSKSSRAWSRADFKSVVPGRVRGKLLLLMLLTSLAVITLFAVGKGALAISPTEVVVILLHTLGFEFANIAIDNTQSAVLTAIRLPRVLLGIVIGAALASAGAAMQGLFRNPLADPGLIGVSAGSALAVTAVIVLGATTFKGMSLVLGALTLPLAGFAGGLTATLLLYQLARHEGRTSVTTMLLAGVAIQALAFAGIGLFTMVASDEQLRNITFWTFGSLGGANWKMIAAITLPIVIAMAWLCRLAPGLNALAFGEAEANHLGFDAQQIKRSTIFCAALLAGFAVSVSGVIGFVALVAPHIIRLVAGPDHRILIPASALFGAVLLVGADVIARTVLAPAELPIGILTALFGAPFFLILLFKQRQHMGH